MCGVVWCGVVWCGVVWCGVVWCGVVWCGVVWCGTSSAHRIGYPCDRKGIVRVLKGDKFYGFCCS